MTTKKSPIGSQFYKNLFDHCQKQYGNIAKIRKAYVKNKQVFGIDYIATNNVESLCSGTFDADAVIYFTQQ